MLTTIDVRYQTVRRVPHPSGGELGPVHNPGLGPNTLRGSSWGFYPLGAVDYGDLAQVFRYRNDNDQALSYFHRALEINEHLSLQLGIAIVCGNLGLVYQKKGDLDLAEKMHKRSLEIDEKLGHQEGMAIQYGNLALVYLLKGQFDEAERLLRTSLAINERLGRDEGIAGNHSDLGSVFQVRGESPTCDGNCDGDAVRSYICTKVGEPELLS